MTEAEVIQSEVDRLYGRLNREAEAAGYHLNPDADFTRGLVKSLIINERRYGYQACPCRLASGIRTADLDIICPCDYRDSDLTDYGTCYCALYVSEAVLTGEKKIGSIPERRPPPKERERRVTNNQPKIPLQLPLPIWRCRVCGYLCARDQPPEVCPICKAKKERFERFL